MPERKVTIASLPAPDVSNHIIRVALVSNQTPHVFKRVHKVKLGEIVAQIDHYTVKLPDEIAARAIVNDISSDSFQGILMYGTENLRGLLASAARQSGKAFHVYSGQAVSINGEVNGTIVHCSQRAGDENGYKIVPTTPVQEFAGAEHITYKRSTMGCTLSEDGETMWPIRAECVIAGYPHCIFSCRGAIRVPPPFRRYEFAVATFEAATAELETNPDSSHALVEAYGTDPAGQVQKVICITAAFVSSLSHALKTHGKLYFYTEDLAEMRLAIQTSMLMRIGLVIVATDSQHQGKIAQLIENTVSDMVRAHCDAAKSAQPDSPGDQPVTLAPPSDVMGPIVIGETQAHASAQAVPKVEHPSDSSLFEDLFSREDPPSIVPEPMQDSDA